MHQRRIGAFLHWCILAFLAFLLLTASACAKAHATTMPDSPPLEMPAPPPREVEPSDTEVPPPMPLPQEPARAAPPRTRPAPPRTEPAKPPAGATPEPPKPETPPIVEPPKPEEAPPKPVIPLQTTPAAAEGEAERTIRATIVRATTDLNRIDPSRLNAGAKTQYDAARGFLRQADAAMRAKNLVFARTVAEKAAVLAAQLAPK
jgi:outer membrane biosynthesis protein TonB